MWEFLRISRVLSGVQLKSMGIAMTSSLSEKEENILFIRLGVFILQSINKWKLIVFKTGGGINPFFLGFKLAFQM
jgi:hypothetical protein